MKKFPTIPILIPYSPEYDHSLTAFSRLNELLNATVLITHYSRDNLCAAEQTHRAHPRID